MREEELMKVDEKLEQVRSSSYDDERVSKPVKEQSACSKSYEHFVVFS